MFSVVSVSLSVWGGGNPYVTNVNLLKLVHLGSLPDLFKLVYCVTHTSISKETVVLQLKGLLALYKILQQSLWLHESRRFRPITFQGPQLPPPHCEQLNTTTH